MLGAEKIDQIMENAIEAGRKFRELGQEQTDKIVHAVYQAGFNNRIHLAQKAHEETGLGIIKDKIIKNIIATRIVYEDIRNQQTVGTLTGDHQADIIEIAQPIGPIFCVTPITNPTSTILFKILIALKTRNPIIIRPHGAARKCGTETARICYEAAITAGAPEHCIQWIKRSTREETLQLMAHKKTALILATGSVSLVRAAYRSGTPTIGVGPGNVAAYIGESADVPFAVEQIVKSKTFDNGTVCASEQSVVVHKNHVETAMGEFKKHQGYILSDQEIKRLEPVVFNAHEKVMNIKVIGQSAIHIAAMAGISVPAETKLLIAPLTHVGLTSPISLEILAPVLGFYRAADFEAGIELCQKINRYGGLGHTVSIFSNDENEIRCFAGNINAGRIVVNTPSSQGALGGTYNSLKPSMTLACGSGGKNITTDNITTTHLLNIQRIARRRVHRCAEYMEDEYFYDPDFTADKVDELCARKYPENFC